MKILFLSPGFYPKSFGGVEKHAFFVARELVKEGNTITVITEADKNIVTEQSGGIKVVSCYFGKKSWFKKFRIWVALWKNKRLLFDSDIIHCHDVFFWYLPFRFLFPQKKVYITFHGYETRFPPSKKAILIRKLSEKLASGNICIGSYIAKWYGTKPNYIIYGGVSAGLSHRVSESQKSGAKMKILFIGRIEQDNGIRTYCDILEELKKRNIHFEFIAIGDGRCRAKFEKYGIVTGFVRQTEKYIQEADIIFASSYLSILESLGQQKLVVSVYENPLKRDYLLTSPFEKYCIMGSDANEISGKIVDYIKHPNSCETFIQSGSLFARKHTWKRVVDIYKKLWNI